MRFSKKIAAAAIAGVMTVALVGCGSTTSDSATDSSSSDSELVGSVTVQGSDTMVNMSQAWAEAFQAENSGVTVSVTGGGSGTGIASLISESVDFANASREIKDEEIEALADPDALVETEVAKDGIAVIVNPENGVTDLTTDQLAQIYRGEITNWSEVGGVDAEIVVLSRDTSSGTYEYFKEAVVGEDNEYTASAQMLASNQAILDEVGNNENAIGYVGVGYVDETVSVTAIDGVAASVEAVLDGTYSLSRSLYMYSDGEVSDTMQAFLDFILSDEGQAVVEEQGFVPLSN